jgi:hypothetical protein|tara:strand:+ start:1430 stop:1612 length:183 start_codon:yes stop_codon:yes gene_type:complete
MTVKEYYTAIKNGAIVWHTMNFETEQKAREFIYKIQDRYTTELIFVENGFVVEYKKKTQL